MARFSRRGVTKILFLDTIAAPTLIPTRTEITGGTKLTSAINAIDGFTIENQPITTPDMDSTFDSSIPGNDQAADSTITFYEDDVDDDMETALAKGTTGFVVFLRKGDVPASTSMDIFPIRVGSLSPAYTVDNDPALFTVKFTITAQPVQGAAVPAAT